MTGQWVVSQVMCLMTSRVKAALCRNSAPAATMEKSISLANPSPATAKSGKRIFCDLPLKQFISVSRHISHISSPV